MLVGTKVPRVYDSMPAVVVPYEYFSATVRQNAHHNIFPFVSSTFRSPVAAEKRAMAPPALPPAGIDVRCVWQKRPRPNIRWPPRTTALLSGKVSTNGIAFRTRVSAEHKRPRSNHLPFTAGMTSSMGTCRRIFLFGALSKYHRQSWVETLRHTMKVDPPPPLDENVP